MHRKTYAHSYECTHTVYRKPHKPQMFPQAQEQLVAHLCSLHFCHPQDSGLISCRNRLSWMKHSVIWLWEEKMRITAFFKVNRYAGCSVLKWKCLISLMLAYLQVRGFTGRGQIEKLLHISVIALQSCSSVTQWDKCIKLFSKRNQICLYCHTAVVYIILVVTK